MCQLPNVREAAGIAEWPDNARFGQAASIRAAQTALNGLQIRSRESGLWLRIPSSAPSKMRFYEGNSLGFEILSIANSRARKHRLFVNYLSSLPSDGGIPLPIHEHGRRDSMSIGTQST